MGPSASQGVGRGQGRQPDPAPLPPSRPPSLPRREKVIRGQEDCLYLNVFTPEGPHTKLPVMVWIHEGAFLVGGVSQLSPRPLVSRGVVLVTLHYRLGTLGMGDVHALLFRITLLFGESEIEKVGKMHHECRKSHTERSDGLCRRMISDTSCTKQLFMMVADSQSMTSQDIPSYVCIFRKILDKNIREGSYRD
ncbi:esterase SG1-like [Penaeus monodon]|uniref:esterase SG1-like n=1 Tax=Penaeus monodon TaxID=6687 RepID=UPI0018A7CD22|nr:esterase SG1-like [Penaeus monodon]